MAAPQLAQAYYAQNALYGTYPNQMPGMYAGQAAGVAAGATPSQQLYHAAVQQSAHVHSSHRQQVAPYQIGVDMYSQLAMQGMDGSYGNSQYNPHESYIGPPHAGAGSSGSQDKSSGAGVGSIGLYDPSAQAALLSSQQGLYGQSITSADPNRTAGGWGGAGPQYAHGATAQHAQWNQLMANQQRNPSSMHFAQAHSGNQQQQAQLQNQLFQQYGSSSSDGRVGWGR